MKHIIGLDIGGTKCAVTLARQEPSSAPAILKKVKFPTESDNPQNVLARFKLEIDHLLDQAELSYSDIAGIGISCGGPLNSEKGIILSPPNLPKWDNIAVCNYFTSRMNVKCYLQNDANACAVAEWKYGAGKGLKNMVFLTFGTGLGAGLILNGRLYRGTNDNAGEIGHVRLENDGPIGYGKPGSCEGFCSGGGIAQMGVKAMLTHGIECELYKACHGNPELVSAKIIAELAENGDAICLDIYRKCAQKLGLTLSILCDILDPEAIIIGGIFMRSDKLLTAELTRVMKEEALIPCKVLKAALGEQVGDYAALSVAEGSF